MAKSKFFSLSFADFIKGSVIAILTGILTFLTSLTSIENNISVRQIIIASVIGLLSYLIKNLFTNNKDEFLKTDK
jgi:hypothetical protein